MWITKIVNGKRIKINLKHLDELKKYPQTKHPKGKLPSDQVYFDSIGGGSGGVFEDRGTSHPTNIPYTMRGFDPSTSKFTLLLNEKGDIYETRQKDASDAEHNSLRGSVTHTGRQFIDQGRGRQDRESRSPSAPKNKKYGQEHHEELENKKEHEERVYKWKNKITNCSVCGGTGHGFNSSDAVLASTGRVGLRTGYGKCRRCNGTGKA